MNTIIIENCTDLTQFNDKEEKYITDQVFFVICLLKKKKKNPKKPLSPGSTAL